MLESALHLCRKPQQRPENSPPGQATGFVTRAAGWGTLRGWRGGRGEPEGRVCFSSELRTGEEEAGQHADGRPRAPRGSSPGASRVCLPLPPVPREARGNWGPGTRNHTLAPVSDPSWDSNPGPLPSIAGGAGLPLCHSSVPPTPGLWVCTHQSHRLYGGLNSDCILFIYPFFPPF